MAGRFLTSLFGLGATTVVPDLEAPTSVNERVARLTPDVAAETSPRQQSRQQPRTPVQRRAQPDIVYTATPRPMHAVPNASVTTPTRPHRRSESHRGSRRSSRRSAQRPVHGSARQDVASPRANATSASINHLQPPTAARRPSESEMNRRNASRSAQQSPGLNLHHSSLNYPVTPTSPIIVPATPVSSGGISVQPSVFHNQFAAQPCRIPMGSLNRDEAAVVEESAAYFTTMEEPPPPYSTLPRDSEQRRPNPDPRVFYPGPPPPPVIEGYIPVVHPSPKIEGASYSEVFVAPGYFTPRLTHEHLRQQQPRPVASSSQSDDDARHRQTWREISVVTLILCPPLGALCLLLSCLATRAFNRGKPDVGRKRAKNALHLAILTMALYGCALIIYLAFKLQKPERTVDAGDSFLWGKV